MARYPRKLEIQQLNSGSQVATLLPLARAWHEGSRYAHLPFSEDKFFRMVASILDRPQRATALFITRDKQAIGVIALATGEAILGKGGCFATCQALFVHPEVRSTFLGGKVTTMLIQTAKAWAKAQGATELLIHGVYGGANGLAKRGKLLGENIVIEVQ